MADEGRTTGGSAVNPAPKGAANAGGAAGAPPTEDAVLARRRAVRRTLTSSPAYMGAVLLLLIIVFSILSPNAFPTTFNARNLLMDASTLLVMAVAMTFVMVAGGFDLSIGSVLVFANVAAAKVMGSMGT